MSPKHKFAIGRLWANRQLRRYAASDLDVAKIQALALRRCLSSVDGSRLARRLDLSPSMQPHEFARAVPLLDYRDLETYIDAVSKGEHRALFHDSVEVVGFAQSSGTTGARKLIPITDLALKYFKRSWRLWGMHLFADHPELLRSPLTQLSGDGISGYTDGGLPVSDMSSFFANLQPRWVRAFYMPPLAINSISDQQLKYYVFLRCLLSKPDVRLIITATPATLLRLGEMLESLRDVFVRDVRFGTVSMAQSKVIPKPLLRYLYRTDVGLAHRLDGLAKQDFRPHQLWPKLKILACWTCGTMGHYLDSLKEYYGDVVFRDIGYSASEGHFTVPLHDNQGSGLLNIHAQYFEFVDLSGGQIVGAHELQTGHAYKIVVSNLQGLVRYQMHDRVLCTGFLGGWPLLRFLNKGIYVADLTGEKLSASQASQAFSRTCQRLGVAIAEFLLAPCSRFPRGYQLVIEKRHMPYEDQQQKFVSEFDAALCEENIIYKEHRDAGKLRPVTWQTVRSGFFEQYHETRRRRSGASAEQFKPICLATESLDLKDVS